MSDMMNFPDTWEEYEKLYGFNDSEEIYTNNSRLIPSFRVKQWLDHIAQKETKQRAIKASDCIRRQDAKDAVDMVLDILDDVPQWLVDDLLNALNKVPSAEPERKKGKWTATYSDCGGDVWVSWKCSNCGYVRKKGWKYTDDGKKPDALFCEMCNADMRGEQDE